VLFGDGAAATMLSAGDGDGGRLVACELCTHGAGFEYGYVPAGGARVPLDEEAKREATDVSGNVRTPADLHLRGPELWRYVSATIPGHVEAFLEKNSLTLEQIDLFVFHQASKLILDSLAKALSLPSEKMFVQMEDVGNLSSASLPYAVCAAREGDAIRPGDRVLLSAFGIGISYGSAIVEF